MNPYMGMLQGNSVHPEAMAEWMFTQGFGSREAWLKVFHTGDTSGLTQADLNNAAVAFQRNPGIERAVRQAMYGRQ